MEENNMIFIKNHQKVAIHYDNQEISYNELLMKIDMYRSLIDIEKGDRVSIFSPNRPELIYSIFAAMSSRGIAGPIDYANSIDELTYVLKDCAPKYIFTAEEAKEKVAEAIEKSQLDIKMIVFEEVKADYTKFEAKEVKLEQDDDDTLLLLYTSGTTGDPKGVMLTKDNMAYMIEALSKYKLFEFEDRFLTLLPLHHVLPLIGSAVTPFYFGSTIVFLKELSSDKIREAFVKYKITMLIGVPRLYELFHRGIMAKINASKVTATVFKLAQNIKSEKIRKKIFKKVHEGFGGHVKYFVSGGAKLDEQAAVDFKTLGFKVMEGYGMTETSPILTFPRPEEIRPGYCGSPIDGLETRFAEDGELQVRGRNVMKGYWNKPEKTREALSEDGWLSTGDLGEFDEKMRLRIVGRKKEMIVLSNGKNINPASIEQEIMKNSKGVIQELAVCDYNNHLNAVIYPNFENIEAMGIQNIKETIKWDIIDKYNSKTSPYKKVLNFKIVKQELPKTKLGKLRRFMLKDLLVGKTLDIKDVEEPKFEEYKLLKDYIKTITKQPFNPNSHIELDLGFDSLDLVELKAFIDSTFGLDLKEEDFSANATVLKLAKYIEKEATQIMDGQNDWKDILKSDIDMDLPKGHVVLLIVKMLAIPLLKLYFGITKKGKQNIINESCIFAGNHQSFVDSFMLISMLPNSVLKKTYFLAKVKHFKSPFMKFLANYGNIIVVDINKNLKETLIESAQILKTGNLVVFPEGIRSRDGELGDFKKAFAILSKELEKPVVPFAINGAYKSMPVGAKFPKPTKVSLEILGKIDPKDLELEEIVDKTKEVIEATL
jgi:long-chain acyl-CoA synthetase